jgi:hypothetical protein
MRGMPAEVMVSNGKARVIREKVKP